jgi:hypothetical protein
VLVVFAVLPPLPAVVTVEEPPLVPPVALVLLPPVPEVPPEARVDVPPELPPDTCVLALPPDTCVLALPPALVLAVAPPALTLPPEAPAAAVPAKPPSCLLLALFAQAAAAMASITSLSNTRLVFMAIKNALGRREGPAGAWLASWT